MKLHCLLARNLMKKILILSVGPVPTSKKSIVEGGGLRAWGIAKGLAHHGISVTVAVPDDFPIKKTTTRDGIRVCNWNFENLKHLCDIHDSSYVLYSRGDLMKFMAEKTDKEKPMIIDLYVPIYIESQARNTKKSFDGLKEHLVNVKHWNYAFPRGDYFLCANNAQYHLYNGVLGAFGRINPLTYENNLLNIVPFGIYKQRPKHTKDVAKGKLIESNDFMLLWFGGIYPWFDINPLLDAVEKLSKKYSNIKLVILGGRNPFSVEPEFIEKYESVVKYTKSRKLYGKNVHFVDWIPYEERSNWYLEADLLINLHNPGTESTYAWRTRVVDFIWGELPMLTSGGDELSEMLAQKEAAVILDDNNSKEIYEKIESLYKNRGKLEFLRKNLKNVKKDFYWEEITLNLANFIKSGRISPDRDLLIKNNFGEQLMQEATPLRPKVSKTKRRMSYAIYLLKEEGVKAFAQKFISFIKNRI